MQNFSIIIPTYREADNIPSLIKRIAALSFNNRLFEVILMDDNSEDGTKEIVSQLQQIYPWLKLIVRTNHKGLSRSVIDGFHAAKYPILVMMDADLSHPPEKIPEMISQLDHKTDIVIGSRYVPGGSIEEKWPWHRKIISKLCAFSARKILSAPVYDPLSGFVAVKKEKYLTGKIDPIGWKLGLEILVKCHCRQIIEVPIQFAERQAGKSKLNAVVAFKYFVQLQRLFFYSRLKGK